MSKQTNKSQVFGKIVFWVPIICLAFAAIVIAVIFGGLLFNEYKKDNKPQILISSYTPVSYRNGSGNIVPILKIGDRICSDNEADFTYSSDDESLLTIDRKGIYYIADSDNAVPRNDLGEIDDAGEIKVTITVHSEKYNVSESKDIAIKTMPESFINLDALEDDICISSIPVWNYTVGANKNSEGKLVMPEPEISGYTFEGWYRVLDDNKSLDNEKFNPADKFYWNNDVTLRARYSATVCLDLEGFGENQYIPKIYYKEELTPSQAEILGTKLQKCPASDDSSKSWEFDGWYTAPGGESGLGVKNGIIEGKFCANSLNPITNQITLYAAWKGTAKLNLTQIICDEDIADVITRDGSVGYLSAGAQTEISVYYHGNIELDSSQLPIYADGGKFDGWYSGLYGAGSQITDIHGIGYYNTQSLNLYDKIVFKINIDYTDATDNFNESLDTIPVVYGNPINYIEQGLLNPQKSGGWSFNGWYVNVSANGETYKREVTDDSRYRLLNDATMYAEWIGKIYLKAEIDNKWEDSLTIIYNEELSLPDNIYILNSSSWALAGWFTSKSGYGEEIISVENYTDNVGLTLYAKLVLSAVRLEYENDNSDSDFLYDLIYGRSIQSLGKTLPSTDKVGDKTGYTPGNGWYNSNREIVTNTMTAYPKSMATLYYKWEPKTYRVTFNSNGGTSITTQTIEVKMGDTIPSFTAPQLTGNNFSGYYTQQIGGDKYFSSGLSGSTVIAVADGPWTIPSDTTLYAHWGEVTYTVTLSKNGGSGGTTTVYPIYGQTMPAATAPTRTGFTFKGYADSSGNVYYNESMIGSKWNKPQNATLTAKWEANSLAITVKNGDSVLNSGTTHSIGGDYVTLSVNVSGGTGDYSYKTTQSNSHLDIKDETTSRPRIKKSENSQSGSVTVTVTDNISKASRSLTFKYETTGGCVATGTLITLADGSQIPVESLIGNEQLLVWNLWTGSFDSAPILFIDCDEIREYEVIHLYFSDGTEVKAISEHGFWDFDLNEYVFLRSDAAKYIGHWFSKEITDDTNNMALTKVQLIDVVLEKEVTIAWSPVTFGHLCYYVNGMLSMPGATEGFINIFDVDPESMKVDEEKMAIDIDKYGLFTYEDFADYIPEEVFYAFNGQYLKVAMGKGLLTWEDIYTLINTYQHFWNQ